jgi:hypothetical protein
MIESSLPREGVAVVERGTKPCALKSAEGSTPAEREWE